MDFERFASPNWLSTTLSASSRSRKPPTNFIDEAFFRMAKHRGRCVARVTRICARSDITTHQRLSHSPLDAAHACRVDNGTSPTTIAHGLEFSIPVCKRHPHFNLDIRIA